MVKSMAEKFYSLKADVDLLKQDRDQKRSRTRSVSSSPPSRSRSQSLSRSRSRSKFRSRSRSRGRHHSRRSRHSDTRKSRCRTRSRSKDSTRHRRHPRSRSRSRSRSTTRWRSNKDTPHPWAEVDPDEVPDYSATPQFSEDEEGIESGNLVEVSEDTYQFLTSVCAQSASNETRKQTRGRYKLPKVPATRTPKVDHIMRTLAPQPARAADRELTRIQTFVLDSLAPVTAILENAGKMTTREITEASSSAAALIGNANARISRLRREKYVTAINKNLTPLVADDGDFIEAAPNLFGADFSKRAKDHLDQVKSLRQHTWQSRPQGGGGRKQFFRKGNPSGRGNARGRGGGSSHYWSRNQPRERPIPKH